jgi:putative transposase
MTEDDKKDVAHFRYSIISDIVNVSHLDHGRQEKIIREKCAQKWVIPHSAKTRISRSGVLRWLKLYRKSNGDIRSLYPKDRCDRGKPRAIDEDTLQALLALRVEMPNATVRFLIGQMKQRCLVTPGTDLYPSTVYRFLNQRKDKLERVSGDCRKFEAELPNDLWQSDVMHGPMVDVDGKMRKTYLIAIIDDHSRLIVHAWFYVSEGLVSYLTALEDALATRGLPRKLYVDNGPAFRSRHLEHITASLNIALIHARPYKPQGKGKIERWFKTVRTSFLPGFKGETLFELNEAIDLWISEVYHRKKHGGTGMTPFERFTASMECLRPAPSNLKDHFRNVARRKVAKDRTVTFEGRLFEAPVPLIGKQVTLLYHPSEPERVEVTWDNRSYGFMRKVDVHVNAKVKRDENNKGNVVIESTSRDYKGGTLF